MLGVGSCSNIYRFGVRTEIERLVITSSRRKNPCLMTDDVELLKVGQACGHYRVGCGGYEKCELRGPVAFGP
jgi:hypothetical protein